MGELTLEEKIEQIGGEGGFFKSESKDKITNVANELIALGVDEDKAISLIEDVWYTSANEYGN
jgi:hypothetical protein